MNRIALIGNGFDLAHGLKTSYSDFIDYIEEHNLKCINSRVKSFKFFEYTRNGDYGEKFVVPDVETLSLFVKSNRIFEDCKNNFYLQLRNHNREVNWVDIESLYFNLLNSCKNIETVCLLNKEFGEVKYQFEHYLKNEVILKINNSIISDHIFNCINENFHLKEIKQDHVNLVIDDIFKLMCDYSKSNLKFTVNNEDFISNPKQLISDLYDLSSFSNIDFNITKYSEKDLKLRIREAIKKDQVLKKNEILFLNFNYTNVDDMYRDNGNLKFKIRETNHIHGQISNDRNKIIFGFGDEYGSEYSNLELKYDNEYFKNIKSFKYLETNNYRNLLDFINTESYQISIFGHSCGHSDRTLLKTIFEHKNCVSIKPYYRMKMDGSDNYFEIIGNISRNFSNKMEMRDKVVNKQYCKPFVLRK